jgi:hypothetical protein
VAVPEDDAESPVEDAESAPDDAAEQRVYELAKAVVRALTPANGRSNPCEEGELRERLDQDGVLYNSADLSPALSLLESNGEAGYDTGTLPDLPYVVHRPIPDNWGGPSRLQPHPPRLVMIKRLPMLQPYSPRYFVLKRLRPY